jgi:LDH2 family malate/lactate/ureidoglycolate dehydrogenase
MFMPVPVHSRQKALKSMKKANFASEIFIPGEIEYRREVASRANGIDLEDKAVGVLNQLLEKNGSSKRLGVAV